MYDLFKAEFYLFRYELKCMKKLLLCLVMCCGLNLAYSQIPEFDRLEMLYAQGHYKLVHRKANTLLDQPDYDFSLIPSFYKSLSLFQLSQNQHWLIRNKNALHEAERLFLEIRKSSDGSKILTAHMFEVSALKKDLMSWAEDLKRRDEKETFVLVQGIMSKLFDDVPDLQDSENSPVLVEDPSIGPISKERQEIIDCAKKYLGVPYVWSGDDPNGFDCSGFTSYVYKNSGKNIPRRAMDQYQSSTKLKEKNVQKGDLVFFDNGSGISHVGIVLSDKGKPLVMIHSSSSKGIVISDVDSSEYWKTRLYGFGSYFD